MSNAGGHPIHFFGLFEMPALVSENEAIGDLTHEAHEILGWAILVLIALHLAGAVKHRLKDRGGETDILKRML
jgi:cytochrome b561